MLARRVANFSSLTHIFVRGFALALFVKVVLHGSRMGSVCFFAVQQALRGKPCLRRPTNDVPHNEEKWCVPLYVSAVPTVYLAQIHARPFSKGERGRHVAVEPVGAHACNCHSRRISSVRLLTCGAAGQRRCAKQ